MSDTLSSPMARTEPEPNLTWITDTLAVGGRYAPEMVEHLAGPLGVKAVVDLRKEDRDDEDLLLRHGLAFLHLPTPDHCAVAAAMLEDGVAFAAAHLDRGERVLIHCEHGIGRSATLALCVLVERGMEPLEALELAKSKRAVFSPSPAQYECWVRWLTEFGGRGGAGWTVPGFDAFAAIAYRHLR
jgi:hypothetical protein